MNIAGRATERTALRRKPDRGFYDRETVYSIIDEAPFCHVGFVVDGSPIVLPTIHARIGDTLFFHGSKSNAMFIAVDGQDACVAVTILDGLVLARSAFHHSMNYRSAVAFGRPQLVGDSSMKLQALSAVVDHVVPGRAGEARPPSTRELSLTTVMSMEIDEVSAKIRTGPPIDDEEDLDFPVWAGVIPFEPAWGNPIPDPLAEARGSLPSLSPSVEGLSGSA